MKNSRDGKNDGKQAAARFTPGDSGTVVSNTDSFLSTKPLKNNLSFKYLAKPVITVFDFLIISPLTRDRSIAFIYNFSCLISTILTSFACFFFSCSTREAWDMSTNFFGNAEFSFWTNVFAYASFCSVYYSLMARRQLKERTRKAGVLSKKDYLSTGIQCGIDFAIHLPLADLPNHFVAGVLQASMTTFLVGTGLIGLRFIDGSTAFFSQVLTDFIFTPLEGPIWRVASRSSNYLVEKFEKIIPSKSIGWVKQNVVEKITDEATQYEALRATSHLDLSAKKDSVANF